MLTQADTITRVNTIIWVNTITYVNTITQANSIVHWASQIGGRERIAMACYKVGIRCYTSIWDGIIGSVTQYLWWFLYVNTIIWGPLQGDCIVLHCRRFCIKKMLYYIAICHLFPWVQPLRLIVQMLFDDNALPGTCLFFHLNHYMALFNLLSMDNMFTLLTPLQKICSAWAVVPQSFD